ncbi:MAG: DUF1351 domain-containing protein [Clostridia bacterium]|nr:DUF1351 domain-containing protein [Clostridia bacterium]
MEQDLIVIKQLPVIEDQLQAVKASIEERVNTALSLVCTEETYKDVKKVRSELNKEFTELEKRRKEVKAGIMAPYDNFERVYKECAADIYTRADAALKTKISEVEDGLKGQKAEALQAYFEEYRESLGLEKDFVTLAQTGIRVGLSDSLSGLKKRAAEFLDRIASDLKAIDAQETRDEVLTEYRKSFNLADAMMIVSRRHQEIEVAKRAREEAEARKAAEAEKQAAILAAAAQSAPEVGEQGTAENVPQAAPEAPLAAPVAMDAPQEASHGEWAPEAIQRYTTTFTVTGTMDQLKALKKFLNEGGYEYV